MLSSLAAFLGEVVTHKRIVGGWLVLLSLGLVQVGEKVYVERTAEIAVLHSQLSDIQATLSRMDRTLELNSEKLNELLVDSARLRAELESHERNTTMRTKGGSR
jgi:hypothetical protein